MEEEQVSLKLDLSQLEKFSEFLARNGKFNKLSIGLSGSLGSGKTTFTKFFINALGYKDTITSPTYSICNEYEFNDENLNPILIMHCDLYRLVQNESAPIYFDYNHIMDLSTDNVLTNNSARSYYIIEWFDLVFDPNFTFDIKLKFYHNTTSEHKIDLSESRKVDLISLSPRGKELMKTTLFDYTKFIT